MVKLIPVHVLQKFSLTDVLNALVVGVIGWGGQLAKVTMNLVAMMVYRRVAGAEVAWGTVGGDHLWSRHLAQVTAKDGASGVLRWVAGGIQVRVVVLRAR